jgi:AcrR family transcriptional regulator
LSKHDRVSKSRPYRMRKRAEQMEATRQRIVEAAVRLHTTLGPANSTISAVAEEAGVTRVTVYRHFPNDEALFGACSQHWAEQHPVPDPSDWLIIDDLQARGQRVLRDLYAWYRENADDLEALYRDWDVWPESARELDAEQERGLVRALVGKARSRGPAARRLRAVAAHVVSFWTWHSMCVEQELTDGEAADLCVSMLVAAGRPASR